MRWGRVSAPLSAIFWMDGVVEPGFAGVDALFEAEVAVPAGEDETGFGADFEGRYGEAGKGGGDGAREGPGIAQGQAQFRHQEGDATILLEPGASQDFAADQADSSSRGNTDRHAAGALVITGWQATKTGGVADHEATVVPFATQGGGHQGRRQVKTIANQAQRQAGFGEHRP